MNSTVHVPILVEPIIQALIEPFLHLPADAETHWIVDCTLGGGGHCVALLEALSKSAQLRRHKILGLDQDLQAVERAKVRFKKEIDEGRLEVVHLRFGEAASILRQRPVLGLMADLGFSSDQLEDAQRGLSFQNHGPLDMRLNPSEGVSCSDWLKTVSETELEQVLKEYGEEIFSRRIASQIVNARSQGNLPKTTQELVNLVVRAVPPKARHGRIHVATRTFQALRIAVNNELGELDRFLEEVVPLVQPGGRIAILSFHSLEDRRVKYKFRDRDGFHPLTKKPIQADDSEVQRNPRSRSAKLRMVEVKRGEDKGA
jgi:16S rRNA (cytosine1402-N4)-methyltransferase